MSLPGCNCFSCFKANKCRHGNDFMNSPWIWKDYANLSHDEFVSAYCNKKSPVYVQLYLDL